MKKECQRECVSLCVTNATLIATSYWWPTAVTPIPFCEKLQLFYGDIIRARLTKKLIHLTGTSHSKFSLHVLMKPAKQPNLYVEILATALRISEFIPDNVSTWFAQVERTFKLRKITKSSAKFNHVTSSLWPKYTVSSNHPGSGWIDFSNGNNYVTKNDAAPT